MKLSDNEILELNELCGALVDGTLTAAQKIRLSQWLAQSEDARRFHVRTMALSASLFEYAGEMQIEEPLRIVRPAIWSWRVLAPLAAAALVMLAAIFALQKKYDASNNEAQAAEFVARLTGSKDCKWIGAAPGDSLQKGQSIELAGGSAEITFDCGAQVELTGPAVLEINSAWDAVLHRGTLRANVPPQAIGFRISNPDVEVIDLGTEFSMITDEKGATEVFVLKGSVEAAPVDAANHEPIVLRETESRRFTRGRVSSVNDSGKKFARLAKRLTFNRPAMSMSYVHWSFDEAGGDVAHAEVTGVAGGSFDARLETDVESVSTSADAGTHGEGRWGRALQFDGRLFAHAPMPGLSASASRTIAFWVKVPEDAPLALPTIVSWGMRGNKKNGSSVAQIGWNHNPAQGTLGALRSDFGHGLAIGATPFRDGRWHHVAVVFMPGKRDDAFTQAKQYVDGRLEQATARLDKKQKRRAAFAPIAGETGETATNDLLWLGHQPVLVNSKKTGDRFRGELDELFIIDRALSPREIVHLMATNTLRQSKTLAAD